MKNPFKMTMPEYKYDTLHAAMKDSLKEPYIGVTQGGSSRKGGPAKVAATEAEVKQGQGGQQASGVANAVASNGLAGRSASTRANK